MHLLFSHKGSVQRNLGNLGFGEFALLVNLHVLSDKNNEMSLLDWYITHVVCAAVADHNISGYSNLVGEMILIDISQPILFEKIRWTNCKFFVIWSIKKLTLPIGF